ncbi:Trimeric coiled-coil oligomerization domain of matrilin [Mactra antiquata]
MMKLHLMVWCLLCVGEVLYAYPTSDCTNKPADVIFILDSSNSIWLNDFKTQTNFVRDVVKEFDIGPGPTQTRVGVLTFGHFVRKEFDLKDKMDSVKITEAVEAITHRRGRTTNTGDAIRTAVNEMFTREAGHRPDVTKVAIVITDGRSQNTAGTTSAAKLAHEKGVKTFAIGVGRRIDFNELKTIASEPVKDYLFEVNSFNLLDSIRIRLAKKACEVTPAPVVITTPRPADQGCGGKPADVVFVVDSAGSITRKDFNKQLQFVQNVVELFDLSTNKTRVGIVVFSHSSKLVLSLDNNWDKASVKNKIRNIKHIGGGTYTSDALRMVRQEAFARGVVRDNVAKIAIVLTDGLSANEELTKKEAELTQAAGINVFAIGIGKGVDLVEIQNIASNPDDNYVFQVGDFNSLETIKETLAIKTCNEKPLEHKKQNDQPVCQVKQNTDLMFIYDTANFGPIKTDAISEFMTEVVSGLDMASGYLHVGRITDNCPTGGNFQLSDKLSAADFQSIQFSSYSNLIKKVNRAGFTSEHGGRDDASNAAVLFIDSDMSGLDDQALQEAQSLGNSSEVFVISIGRGPIINQFAQSFRGNNFFQVNSFSELRTSAKKFLTKLCYYFTIDYLDYDIQPVDVV